MGELEFENWCDQTGHITATDWNYQTIGNSDYYFIINPKTNKFSLVKFDRKNIDYQILVSDFDLFNEYAKIFHEETNGSWK